MEERDLMALGHVLTAQHVWEWLCTQTETACSHFYGTARLARSLTTGTVQNDLCDIGCTGIRSEKAIVQNIIQKWAGKSVSEQVAIVLCLSHTGQAG